MMMNHHHDGSPFRTLDYYYVKVPAYFPSYFSYKTALCVKHF